MSDYMPTDDEIETAYHEFASDLTKAELKTGAEGTSLPPEFVDWKVAMHAFRRWLKAHDAKVEAAVLRDAADKFEESNNSLYGAAIDGIDWGKDWGYEGWTDPIEPLREYADKIEKETA